MKKSPIPLHRLFKNAFFSHGALARHAVQTRGQGDQLPGQLFMPLLSDHSVLPLCWRWGMEINAHASGRTRDQTGRLLKLQKHLALTNGVLL